MKIVYLVNFNVDKSAGKEKATREKAFFLKKILGENNFHFFYPKYDSENNLQVLFNKIFFDFTLFFKLFKLKNIDAVIQRTNLLPFSRLLLKLRNVKVFSECHSDFKEEIKLLNKSKLEITSIRLFSVLFDLNYKFSDGIIYNHPALEKKLGLEYKIPSTYSYNGCNPANFYIQDFEKCREELGIPQNQSVFLILGSVTQWRGVDFLIDIFNQKNIIDKNYLLYIVGADESDYVKNLKNINKNVNVHFVKNVSLDIARKYINASTFCLIPVKENRVSPGSPLKLYDYAACGKPIITQQNVLGYSDEVEKYNLGYCIDFADTEKASEELINITEQYDKNKEQAFQKNNREGAEEKFSWEQRMHNWINFVKKEVGK